jgi:hypothetical protein
MVLNQSVHAFVAFPGLDAGGRGKGFLIARLSLCALVGALFF